MTLDEVVFMVDFVDSFGKYAEKVWKLLTSEGPQTEKNLIGKTNLKNNEFYCAVGWLAKENKICREDTTYMLGETNLTNKIGKDAGMVWKMLDMWGEVDIESISRLAQIDENDVFYAVGWLAREEKLDGKKSVNAKGNFLFWLK